MTATATPTPACAAGRPQPQPKAQSRVGPLDVGGVCSDDWNRPDGTIGAPWVQKPYWGWVVSNHQATTVPNWTTMLCDTGSGDGTIQTTLVNGNAAPYAWIVFRYVDDGDAWVWGKIDGDYKLGYFSAHAFVVKADTGISSRDGDVLQVVMNGSTVTGLLNGVVRARAGDGAFQTATWHGLGGGYLAPAGVFGPYVYNATPAPVGPVVTTGVDFTDHFNRPNGDIGGPWNQRTWKGWSIVNASQATTTAGNWTGAIYGAGSADGTVQATLVNGGSAGFAYLVFRYQDDGSLWLWGKINGDYQLGYFSNHAWYPRADTGISAQDGDVLEVVLQGSRVTAVLNGVTRAVATDTMFASVPWHGLGSATSTNGIFDDFSYSHVAAPVGGIPVEAVVPVTQGYGLSVKGQSPDPVDTSSGTFQYSHADLAIAGRGPSPAFVRSYHSSDPRSGVLGPGWTHNDAIHLASPGDGTSDVVLVTPEGRSDRFVRQQGGTYTPPPSITTSLVRNQDGTFTATLMDQTAWSFTVAGQLTKITDRNGNASTLTYNGQGQLTGVSDPAGRGSLTLGYTGGALTSVTDWASPARSVQFGYDTNSPPRLHTVTDRNGKVTTYGYDGTSARLTTITDANSHTAVTMTYDAQGRVQTQKDAMGLVTGQQTSFGYVTNGDGTQTTTVTLPATSLDPSWHPLITDTYDTAGRLVQRAVQPASGETDTERYGYTTSSFRASVTDARGATTQYCYDADEHGTAIQGSFGNMTRVIAPAPGAGQNPLVSLLKYDTKHNLIETVSPKGVGNGSSVSCATDVSGVVNSLYAVDFTYDGAGALLQSVTKRYTDPELGQKTATTTYEYTDGSNPGLPTWITPPRGNTGGSPDHGYATQLTYVGSGGQAGMLQQSKDALGNATSFTYDSVGRKLSTVDPNGQTWSAQYDGEDRVVQASAPAPQSGSALVTQAQYDPAGNRTVVIDPNGQVTTYRYDVRDSLQEVDESPSAWTDPNAVPSPKIAVTYAYDHLGNLVRVTRAAGDATNERATAYAYDGLNRLRQETQYPSWPAVSPTLVTQTAYDPNGNRTSVTDPLGKTTTFGYDAVNRLTTVTFNDPATPNVTYAYDPDGNRASMQDGTGTTTYAHDELGQLTSVTSPGGVTTGSRYDLDGGRTKLVYPDGTAVTSTLDKAGRLASLQDWASRQTSYTYFPDGNVQTTTNANGTTTAFSEDHAQRLTQVWNKTGTGATISQHAYTLDGVGNRTQVQETLAPVGGGQPTTATTTYAYDHRYQLLGDGTRTWAYDPAGNRQSVTVGGTATAYSYDKADRITAAGAVSHTVDANGNTKTRGGDSFVYDQANRLLTATVSGTTTTNVYDGDGKRVSQTVGTSPATTYAYDVAGGLPVVLTDGSRKYVYGLGLTYTVDSGGNVQVYHADGLGSVRAITDASGVVNQTLQTDAYGVVTQSQGSVIQPFGFTGQQVDPSGLVYLRARFYDPTSGRFMSRDPRLGTPGSP